MADNTNFVNFKVGTSAAYAALAAKDANTLYFLNDAKKIMKGEDDYSSSVIFADTAPAADAAIPGKIYIVDGKIITYTANESGTPEKVDIYDPSNMSGATFTEPIVLPGDPTSDNEAANKGYVDKLVESKIAANDAMRFKGTLGEGGTITVIPTANVRQGDTYKVITAGTYAGNVCEVGDMIIALVDAEADSTDSNWSVVQGNIDGAVTGPTVSVAESLPVFDGATGKVIKDSGKKIGGAAFEDTASANTLATEAAVAAYFEAHKPVWVEI